ncbi:hypothetical protein [Schleiferilactobacillus shenzhenensis]|uniref:Uncharacterized protein n=1 Tax=Schleiferilactobacillus shenzhenensis LY-73 TaxID=1231336 RepID=U4TVE8_9LACO|nr:hypothetical protein [Schleiferilactobacillus shenzhenensis]ERL65362.1 hypothetical protein L248_2761 [Schleiferilactobacillus shenzhenensis LY-73]
MTIQTTVITTDKTKLTADLGMYLEKTFPGKQFSRTTDRYEGVAERLTASGVQDELAEIIGYYPEASAVELKATHVSETNDVTLTLTVVYPDVQGPRTETIQVPLRVAELAADAE